MLSCPPTFQSSQLHQGQLAGDIALSQSRSGDLISSGQHNVSSVTTSNLFLSLPGSSQIKEWRDELGSLLDSHVQHFQREVDKIQELLEDLHHVHAFTAHQRLMTDT